MPYSVQKACQISPIRSKKPKNQMTKHQENLPCTQIYCFCCITNEPDPYTRRSKLAQCFSQLHRGKLHDNLIIALLSDLWSAALAKPDSAELPCLGIFECMAQLINRCIKDRRWIRRGKNVCISYYAAHIIGSYAMNKAELAEMAVESGVIPPLMELLRGKMSWVEQRVAVRALGHIASHEKAFKAIVVHEDEIIDLSMKISSTCFDTVYDQFLSLKGEKRVRYHRDLIVRGRRYGFDLEMENRKAEEWCSQLQCWSLYLINCFAVRKTSNSIDLICKKGFLEQLCGMWGGLRDANSFSGVCLIRNVCLTSDGRKSVANSKAVVESLCNLCRSSDEGQGKAIESILLLLQDIEARARVIDLVAPFMADLVELKILKRGTRNNVGDTIARLLLQDFGRRKKMSWAARCALEEVWIKEQRKKKEDKMSEEELRQRKAMAGVLKREGNKKFWSGDAAEAVESYTKALDLCPLQMKRERVILHSNRAQCYLLLTEAELAISDATRALCLSGDHSKSLWRRSQAYDLLGMARHSLTDSLMFINLQTESKSKRRAKVPFYAVRMLKKQINATNPWLPQT